MTTLLQDIRSADWQPKRNKIGSVVEGYSDINQCIHIILHTRKGSDPHRPEFGCDVWLYIDYPVNQAVPHMVREIIDAINAWETRITIERIIPVIDGSTLTLSIEWKLKTASTDTQPEVYLYVAA